MLNLLAALACKIVSLIGMHQHLQIEEDRLAQEAPAGIALSLPIDS